MSTSVAALPDNVGISSITDRRPRRFPQGRPLKSQTPAAPDALRHEGASGYTPAPPDDEPLVPAETLFATALFANALLRMPPSANEMQLRASHGWQPPDSALRLKDKTI